MMKKLHLSFLPALCTTLALSSLQVIAQEGPPIHGIADLSHEFSFYTDGRFQKQYLPQQKIITNWGNLYDIDTKNINLILLLGCDPHLTYNAKDINFLKNYLKNGGCVLIGGSKGNKGQNDLAKAFGASFEGKATGPFKGTKAIGIDSEIEGGNFDYLKLNEPKKWTPLVQGSEDQVILAAKKIGKGVLLLGSRNLFGNRPDASDPINNKWVTPILQKAASTKEVDTKAALPQLGSQKMGNVKDINGITFYYSDYMAPYFNDMVRIQGKTTPLIEKRMGVPLSEGMGSKIGLLSTGGGGFSAGGFVGLAVFWENFPKVEHGMIEFLTHEFTHSWVLPHPEVWNEPIATYVGDLVMGDAGYKEEGDKRIAQNIQRASRIDPTMKLYDINGNATDSSAPELDAGKKNEIHWGKSFWVFEELKKSEPDFLGKYFRAKRKFVPAKLDHRYNMNDTVAIISIAMGKDMFPWFNEHGMTVDPNDTQIPWKENLK